MPDSKSWGGQFNTMSPPIQKLGGICPPNPPQGTPLSYGFMEKIPLSSILYAV